jgi:uncharacterized repeat protein (TIGR01451 family)
MRWAEWILRLLVTPSRPARRMPRLAVLPLEDRATPHAGDLQAVEPPATTDPAVVKENPPADPGTAKGDVGEVVTVEAGAEGQVRTAVVDGPADTTTPNDAPVIYTMAAAPQPKAPFPQIGDKVWRDTNGNGVQDPGEPGLAFVTLQLYRGSALVGTTTTNGAGEYAFNRWNVTNGTADPADDGLKANTAYQIRVAADQPALVGLRPTLANQGTGNAGELTDSDATATATGAVLDLTVGTDELYPNYDIGYTTAATIGNLVWHDANNNGVKDPTETGIPGVTVRLLNATGTTQVATTTTGADGSYLFTGLVPGTYVVEIASSNFAAGGALAGLASSTGKPGAVGGPVEGLGIPGPDVKTDGTDTGILVNGTVRAQPVTVGASGLMENRAVDFGFFHSATLTGKVFIDKNGNGRIDPEDTTGLANVKVRVAGPAGVFTGVTDAAGSYAIGAVPAGTYTVTEVAQPAGYRSSTPNLATTSVAGGGTATVNFGEARMVDLWVGERVNSVTVGQGGILTLTYRVKNLGTLDATGVVVTAPLPAGFHYVGSDTTGSVPAKYDPTSQRVNVGTLAAGAEAVVTLRVRVTQPGAVRLRATAQALETEDDVRNNTVSLVVTTVPAVMPAPMPLRTTGATSAWILGSGHW